MHQHEQNRDRILIFIASLLGIALVITSFWLAFAGRQRPYHEPRAVPTDIKTRSVTGVPRCEVNLTDYDLSNYGTPDRVGPIESATPEWELNNGVTVRMSSGTGTINTLEILIRPDLAPVTSPGR